MIGVILIWIIFKIFVAVEDKLIILFGINGLWLLICIIIELLLCKLVICIFVLKGRVLWVVVIVYWLKCLLLVFKWLWNLGLY